MKKLILVTSPPASGKTYIAKKLSEALRQVVYLDKDVLIKLSKQIFVVANSLAAEVEVTLSVNGVYDIFAENWHEIDPIVSSYRMNIKKRQILKEYNIWLD